MSEENEEVVEGIQDTPEDQQEVDQEQATADEAAAFEASFHEVNTPQDYGQEEEVEEAPQYLTADQAQEMLQARIAEIEQGFNKVRDQAFGKIGELNRTLQGIQSRPVAESGIKLSKAEFNKLKEYDPELAQSLAEDLKNVMFEGSTNTNSPTRPEIGQYVSQTLGQALTGLSRNQEVKLVRMLHPDASDIVNSPEFGAWMTEQPQDVQDSLHNYDAENFVKRLVEFKNWRKDNQSEEQSKKDKLRRAAMPRKSGSAAPSEETDAFLAGFKAVRGV